MDLARFLGLKTTPNGSPVVTLMADPSMKDADGSDVGFVSLVDRGANLRTFHVVKAEGEERPADPATVLTPPNNDPWWRRWFGFLVGGVASKSDPGGPVTFDAAMAQERLRRARWEATDALWDVLGNIVAGDATDKASQVETALNQFSNHVKLLIAAGLTLKSEDRATLGAELALPSPSLVSKAGRMISAANVAKLTEALDAIRSGAATVSELLDAATVTPGQASKAETANPDHPSQEDPNMLTPAQVETLAIKASENAVRVAKSAGITDPSELIRLGSQAFAETVAKVAIAGPAQPAMHADTLNRQADQSGGMGGGNFGEPMAQFQAAITSIGNLVAKQEVRVAKLEATVDGTPAADGKAAEPGLIEVVTKAMDAVEAIHNRVAKIAEVPAAPRSAGDPELARKSAADPTWSGSALDLPRPKLAKA